MICFIPILLMLIDKTYVFQNPKTSHSNDDCAVGSPLAMTANSPAHETYLLDEIDRNFWTQDMQSWHLSSAGITKWYESAAFNNP